MIEPAADVLPLLHRIKRFWWKIQAFGLKQAITSALSGRQTKVEPYPLARADQHLILASSVEGIRQFAQTHKRTHINKEGSAGGIESLFPLTFTDEQGITLRYQFLPALAKSRGLVVIFHGYRGFDIQNISYPWAHFDVLSPLDNYGWNKLGSWFWGERGNNFVDRAFTALLVKIKDEVNGPGWYGIGASMGGFAALYHGIKSQANGIYVMTPIIEIESKIRDYRRRGLETSYTFLAHSQDEQLLTLPNIYRQARAVETLPPLFLTQNQYDRSNPFGTSTLPLLEIYAEKRGWVGLRVQPAIGHQGHDGSYEEAQYFFTLIATKSPPRRVDFYTQDEGL